jgi:hypothetical protein
LHHYFLPVANQIIHNQVYPIRNDIQYSHRQKGKQVKKTKYNIIHGIRIYQITTLNPILSRQGFFLLVVQDEMVTTGTYCQVWQIPPIYAVHFL